jgi:hypothetical protein
MKKIEIQKINLLNLQRKKFKDFKRNIQKRQNT